MSCPPRSLLTPYSQGLEWLLGGDTNGDQTLDLSCDACSFPEQAGGSLFSVALCFSECFSRWQLGGAVRRNHRARPQVLSGAQAASACGSPVDRLQALVCLSQDYRVVLF